MTGRTALGDMRSPATKGGRRREDHPQTPADPESDALDLKKRSELLWEAPPRPSRGSKPTMSREDIVQAAISVADRNGLAALTMAAVAERLGFTTMALYRYFPNKEALIDASVDAAMGTPPPRSGPRESWRQEVNAWAYAKRAMLIARPWLAELPFVAAPHGPNWLSWHEALLESLADTGLSPEDLMDMLSVIHAYVSGASDTAISLARARSRGMADELWAQAVGRDLCRAIHNPRYPRLSAILTSQSGGILDASPLPVRAGRPRTMEEGFAFGLQRVLDGIARYIDSNEGA